jgi:hypothetical protein
LELAQHLNSFGFNPLQRRPNIVALCRRDLQCRKRPVETRLSVGSLGLARGQRDAKSHLALMTLVEQQTLHRTSSGTRKREAPK